MTTDVDLADRVAELEERAQRLVLAGDGRDQGGWGAWHNLLETRLMEERDFFLDVVARALAEFQNQIIDACKVLITEAMAQRIRGTFDAQAKYTLGDVVALDGASFIARRDDPGVCPGGGWQLLARQGQRGVAGPKGERGPPGPTIEKWLVDRNAYRITPVYSGGIFGPALELRELFEPSQDDGATR
jgi:hypothetical protein